MRDIGERLTPWFERGDRFALATVTRTWSSAPRQPGTSMAVSSAGEAVGSVSGGCVEGDVYERALLAIESGISESVTYGVSDDDAFAVGLTCGGTLEIFIQPVDAQSFPHFGTALEAVMEGIAVTMGTAISSSRSPTQVCVIGSKGHLGDADPTLRELVAGVHGSAIEDSTDYVPGISSNSVFIQHLAPPAHLLIFGAIDIAGHLAHLGKFLGYRVTICDARPTFATKERFPDADEIVIGRPQACLDKFEIDGRTAICVLTHDSKFDVPILERVLHSAAFYIGAMGSRKTNADRLQRLQTSGLSTKEMARLISPIGLDINGYTAAETALSIMSQVSAVRLGGSGRHLSELEDNIHRKAPHLGACNIESHAIPSLS